MIANTNNYKNAIGASVRIIEAKVEVYQSGTLAATYTKNDAIKSIDIERVGEDSKFFGFSVTHKANIKLRDIQREINLSTDNYFKIYLGVKLPDNTIEYISYPKLFITEVNRNELTGELSITSYDTLDKAKTFTMSDLTLETPYTIKNVIEAIATKLGLIASVPDLEVFNTNYPNGANFDGSETLQEVLKAAAEATQTICYIDNNDNLVFKRLDKDGAAVKELTQDNYINLNNSTNRRLATICHATELGDNVSASKMEKSNNTINIDLGDIELCSIGDVKDELIVENRRAKIIKRIGKVIFNGSEKGSDNGGWKLYSQVGSTLRRFGLKDNSVTGSLSMKSNRFLCFDLATGSKTDLSLWTQDTYWAISDANSKWADANEFKTWLSTNNVIVYYQLATPEEIDFDISSYNLADGVYYGESTQEIRSGKNKFKLKDVTSVYGKYTNLTDNSFTLSSNSENRSYIIVDIENLKANTTYNFSYDVSNTNPEATTGIDAYYEKDGSWAYFSGASGYYTNKSFTLPDSTKMQLRIYGTYKIVENISTITNMQLEEGTAKTSFEPYGAAPSPDYPSEIVNKEAVDAYISYPITGTTQYVRDNPFWELREDIKELLETAIDTIGEMTINQFECEWRGDMAVEIGDKLALITKDNKTFNSYLLNDSISYNGALVEKTEWQYTDSEETESNPSTLGEALKQTYARVDKANKEITILASETQDNKNAISNLQINTNAINASVQEDINNLTNSVNAKMSASDVQIAIQSELSNGVDKVKTSTGFTFDENGLTISKSGSEMETNVDEDGLSVYRDDEEVLTADNEGVKAYNLHARTYLIIGESSRLEDYEKDGELRTGCFWIGGAE